MSEPVSRILQVSTADIEGGAERIAWDLFMSYRALGYQSWLAVGMKRSQDPDVFSISKGSGRHSRSIPLRAEKLPCAACINRGLGALKHPARIYNWLAGYEDFDHPKSRTLLNLAPEPPDILHCHNLHGSYFDLRALPDLSHQVPTVLTLHDAWLLAGHCAHSLDCDRWKTGCGNCPDLSLYPAIRRDATAYNWQRKAGIYEQSRLYVVTPCQWLMDKVGQSMLKPGIVGSKVIPNGVDLKVFHPAEQAELRQKLELPADAKILLFTANRIRKNIWKDYRALRSALTEIARTGTKVLCIALGEEAPPERIGNLEIRFIPYLREPGKVARYYQAADLYLHPARVDTFPNTVVEAIACGTPVVASTVGGIPEQIMEGRTGFLVPPGDVTAMSGRVLDLLADEELRLRMGRDAAEDATRRFGRERMVREYLAFYQASLKSEDIYN